MPLKTQLFPLKSRLILPLLAASCFPLGGLSWYFLKIAPVQQHIASGIENLRRARPAEAEKEWRTATQLDPNNARAWQLLGEYYLAAGSWAQSVKAFEQLQKIAPATPQLHSSLALCALQMNDDPTAQREAKLALQKDKNDVQALQILAHLSQSQNRPDEQLKYLQRATQAQPQDIAVLMELAKELADRLDYESTLPITERALQLDGDNIAALVLHGTALFNLDDTDAQLERSKSDFEKVLRAEPKNLDALTYLGRIAMRQEKPRLAIEYFKQLSAGRPYASAHFQELANAYRKIGQTQKADALSRRYATLKQLNLKSMVLKDRAKNEPGDFDTYLQLGILLLQNVETNPDIYYLYRFRRANDQIQSIHYYLQHARQLRPQDARARAAIQQLEDAYLRHLQAGSAAEKKGALATAHAEFEHAALLQPDDSRAVSALNRVKNRAANAVPEIFRKP